MKKNQFLALHYNYLGSGSGYGSLNAGLSKSDYEFEKSRLDHLKNILDLLKTGETLKKADRETFYTFALELPSAPGSGTITLIDEPFLYTPDFISGTLEPILVQGELTYGPDQKPIREFRTAFYIRSDKDHSITKLMRRQQEADGSNVSLELLVDSLDVYGFMQTLSRR